MWLRKRIWHTFSEENNGVFNMLTIFFEDFLNNFRPIISSVQNNLSSLHTNSIRKIDPIKHFYHFHLSVFLKLHTLLHIKRLMEIFQCNDFEEFSTWKIRFGKKNESFQIIINKIDTQIKGLFVLCYNFSHWIE